MLKANGFLAVRIAVALCVVLFLALWLPGQFGGYSNTDTDADGMDDGWESAYGLGQTATEAEDPDGDGLLNGDESALGTDPTSQDTDCDGLTDAEEAVGRLALWGEPESGPGPYVAAPDFGLTALAALSGGCNYMAALTRDGAAVCWGDDSCGQCDVPYGETTFTAVAAGIAHTLAVRPDGTVAAWGLDNCGQCGVPYDLEGVEAVSGGYEFSAALLTNRAVVCWGSDAAGQCSGAEGITGVVAIAAGCGHVSALMESGAVIRWGAADVPVELTTGPALAVASGWDFTVVLMDDGTVSCWGENGCGQLDAPEDLTNAVAIACGRFHAIAATADGRVVGWGLNDDGQADEFGTNTVSLLLAATERCSAAMPQGVTDPTDPDTDHDGLSDGPLDPDGAGPILAGPDAAPQDPDRDGDGLPDGWEVRHGFDPDALESDCAHGPDDDPDGDGLSNAAEFARGTGPFDGDTDDDYFSDGPLDPDGPYSGSCEAGNPDAFPLDPAAWLDTDGDGLPDELHGTSTTGLAEDADDDNDGMGDLWELGHTGFNTKCGDDAWDDFDGDRLPNAEECANLTDPWLWDTDGDGLSDYWETRNARNPSVPEPDGDGDGLPDAWEAAWFGATNKTDNASADADGDGFSNWAEFSMGSDPAFAVLSESSSRGRHRLAWNAVGPATNVYSALVRRGGTPAAAVATNATSVSFTGNLCPDECSVELSAYDPSVGAARTAGATFRQPSQPNLTVWKIADPFEIFPPSVCPPDGEPVIERTIRVGQDSSWPRQFFLSSSCDGTGGAWFGADGFLVQVADDCGNTNELTEALEWQRVDVGAGATSVTVRVTWGAGANPLGDCGSGRLYEPLYLLGWAPGISFSNDVTMIDLEDGRRVALSPDGTAGLKFRVDYGGRPGGADNLSQAEIDAYASPFGVSLPYSSTAPAYSRQDGTGPLTGGVLPPCGAGAYSAGAFVIAGRHVQSEPVYEYKEYPTAMSGFTCAKSGDGDRGAFPFDADCYYEGMNNGLLYAGDAGAEGNEESLRRKVEIGAEVSLPGGGLGLTLSETSHTWGDGEASFNVGIRLEDGTFLASATVYRGEDDPPAESGESDCYGCSGAGCHSGGLWDGQGCSECGSCADGNCLKNQGGSTGSVRFRLPLGFTSYKTLCGMLWFSVPSNSVVITPSLFSLVTNSAVSATFHPGGGPHTVACQARGGRRVSVDEIQDGVRVSVWDSAAASAGVDPDHVWKITNEGGAPDRVRITRSTQADSQALSDDLYACDGGLWTKTDRLGGGSEYVLHEGGLETLGWKADTRVVRAGPGGLILSGSRSRTERLSAGSNTVYRETESGVWDGLADGGQGGWRTTRMAYWSSAASESLHGQPKLRVAPHNGFWEYRTYDADGRETLRATPLDGSAAPDFVSNAVPATFASFLGREGLSATVTVTGYDGARAGSPLDYGKPRQAETFVVADGGVNPLRVSCSWHEYRRETAPGDDYAVLRHRETRAAGRGSARSDFMNDWTETVSYADEVGGLQLLKPLLLRGRPLSEARRENGTVHVAAWSYSNVPDANADGYPELQAVVRRGVEGLTNGVPMRSTYEVETLDGLFGRALRRETRLHTGGADDPVLAWEESVYDGRGRLLGTAYSDGTRSTNEWGCCQLQASAGRDGVRREVSETPSAAMTLTEEVSAAALPGAAGRYPATAIYADALGREVRSVRKVMVDGNEDPAYASLTAFTGYPCGTDGCRVTTNHLGAATVTRRTYEGGAEVDETATPGVTTRVTRVQGGDTVTLTSWADPATGQPKWTCERRRTSWRPSDGRRAETVTVASSDAPAYTASETVYDFYGRVASAATPQGATLNEYENSFAWPGRLARTSRTGAPDTLYAYDELGEAEVTASDADGDGQIGCAGPDRVARTRTRYMKAGADWWRVTSNEVWRTDGGDAPSLSSVSAVRLTGLGGPAPAGISGAAVLTAQSLSVDGRGQTTHARAYADPSSAASWQVTDTPASASDAVVRTVAGRTVSAVTATGVGSSYGYDGFARQTSFTDGRGNTSVTHYDALGLADYTEDAASNRTAYGYDAQGRRTLVTDALTNATHTAYDPLGRVTAVWGAAYPAAYAYDTAGRKTAMATTRDASFDFSTVANSSLLTPNSSLDVTRWNFDHATGLLTNKVYADGTGTLYAYDASGRLATRAWARGVTTTYAYDFLGQLTNTAYSDGTPDVAYAYDRIGRRLTAVTSCSSNVFTYAGLDQTGEFISGSKIEVTYDSLGRVQGKYLNPKGTIRSSPADTDCDFTRQYRYSPEGLVQELETGRPDICYGSAYSWLPGLERIVSTTIGNSYDFGTYFVRRLTYEGQRDSVKSITNAWSSYNWNTCEWDESLADSHAYANDALGRRTVRTDSDGSVVTDNAFGYNLRSEVQSALMGTNAYDYAYDPIGNRVLSAMTAADTVTNLYAANALNQYSNLQSTAYSLQPSYDADGNMITNGPWAYTWDAENRMTAAISNNVLRVDNTYDHQSRRIRKEVYVRADSTCNYERVTCNMFLYDGWNVIREAVAVGSGSTQSAVTNYYTWGLDLSGTLQGAGGVGGLLAVTTLSACNNQPVTCNTYYPTYDANGNVTAYLDATGGVAARREFDAFGNTIALSGPLAGGFTYWFSTKYLDEETGLYMYPFRPYIPSLARWATRDPLEEGGGRHLYGYCENDGLNRVDFLGLLLADPLNTAIEVVGSDARNNLIVAVVKVHEGRKAHRLAGENALKRLFAAINCKFFQTGFTTGLGQLPQGSVARYASLIKLGDSAVFPAAEFSRAGLEVADALLSLGIEPVAFEELVAALQAFKNGGRAKDQCYTVCDKIVKYADAMPVGPLKGIIKYKAALDCATACEKECCDDGVSYDFMENME